MAVQLKKGHVRPEAVYCEMLVSGMDVSQAKTACARRDGRAEFRTEFCVVISTKNVVFPTLARPAGISARGPGSHLSMLTSGRICGGKQVVLPSRQKSDVGFRVLPAFQVCDLHTNRLLLSVRAVWREYGAYRAIWPLLNYCAARAGTVRL